ncbi:carboxymuconolactone decarboxylase family protein [candidate division KSB1 bacterium]
MDRLIKELAGLSASIAGYSFHHLDYHIEQAGKLGATEDQIQNAVKTGLSKVEVLNYRMIKTINFILPELDISEIVSSVKNYGNSGIRIPF